MTSALQRPSRGAIATGVGAAVLAVALALPWISLPGGAFAHEVLTQRGEPIPATGAAWRSLPLLSALLVVLVATGALVTLANVQAWSRQLELAGLAALYGLVVFAALVVKLFVDRVAGDQTAVGAGGYAGVAGAVTIAVGALVVLLDLRTGRRPSPRRPAPPEPPPPRLRPRTLAGVAAALLVAYLATRLSFLDRFPYFFDEGIYADQASLASQSTDDLFVALEIGQGPLMTWLSVVWIKLGFAPLTAVRLVSVVAGLLTVAAVGLLARQVWDATVGCVAAALCVVIPFFLVHDGIGIYEPLVTLIMTGALLLQIAFARRPDLRIAAALGLVVAAGLLTKQNTLPALVLLPVSLLCFDWSQPGRSRRLAAWVTGVGLVVVMAAAAELIQRTSPYWEEREVAREDFLLWPVRSLHDVLDDPFGLLEANWTSYRPAIVGYVTIPLLLAAAAGAVLGWRARPRVTAVLLAWVLVPFWVGMLFQLRPFPRHAMFLVPPLIVLAAYALVRAARFAEGRLPRRVALAAGAAAAALVLAPAVVLDARVLAHPATARYPGLDHWQYVVGWPAGGPWRGATEELERRAADGQVVILTPGPLDILRLSLDSERYVFAKPGDPLAAEAQFGVYDTAGFPVDPKGFDAELARQGFAEVARFRRPKGSCSGPREPACGGAVVVFERR